MGFLGVGCKRKQPQGKVLPAHEQRISIGVAIGIGGAFWLTRFLAGFPFGVKTLDPIAFFAMPLLLSAFALLAVWIPAKRATRVDPMTALRVE